MARVTGLDITRSEDIGNTRCALIVGRNPSIADPVEWAALKAAKKRDARIIVVDPKHAGRADDRPVAGAAHRHRWRRSPWP